MTVIDSSGSRGAWTPACAGVSLPPPYFVLPHSVAFVVPGFLRHGQPTSFVLAPEPVDCRQWFERFASRVTAAVGVKHLPVCRMSDGEFLLLFGHQSPSLRHPAGRRLWLRCRECAEIVRQRVWGFHARTAKGVSSGALSYAEMREHVPILSLRFADVAREGILGLHLSWGPAPFQEHYFPAVSRWLDAQGINLTIDNYVPFYFVYALLRGPLFPELVGGRRLLVVHSATGEKRQAIERSLQEVGPRAIEWLGISPTRSYAESLDLSGLRDKPDICLLGAGVGKAALFPQLEPLGVPCLDAGYAFEAWADPDKQWDRPFMTPDATFDQSRVRF